MTDIHDRQCEAAAAAVSWWDLPAASD